MPMKDTPTATVLVLVETGSKYETKDINGLSHFLEHMCFKGTKNRPQAIDISRELDSLGAQYNAFTSQEFTGYYAKAQAKKLPQLLDIIADMYLHPTLDQKEIEKERGVIIEEINMYEDLPQSHVHDLFSHLLYGDQPAGWEIAGPREVVRRLSRNDFVKYRDAHYVASSTIVMVAGNIDEKKVNAAVQKAFEKIPATKKGGKLAVKEKQSKPEMHIQQKKTDQMHLVIGVRSYNVFDKKLPALKVLASTLGGGMSSRLFQRMRDQMGVCYYVRAGSDELTDHGVFAVSAGVDKNRLVESLQAIIEECKKIADEPLSPAELRKIKDFMIGNMYLNLESSDSVAQYYGLQEVVRKEMRKPAENAKKIEAVTAAQVQAVAREIFQDKKLNLAIIGDVSDEAAVKKALHF